MESYRVRNSIHMHWNLSDRVIKLVLPTDWSPSKTIFVRFGGAEEKSAPTGVVGVESMVVIRKSEMSNGDKGRPRPSSDPSSTTASAEEPQT